MFKRKAIIGYAIAALSLISISQIDFNTKSNLVLAAEETSLNQLPKIEEVFLKQRENVNFKNYIETLKKCLKEATKEQNDVAINKTVELLTTAVINSIEREEAKSLLKEYETLAGQTTNPDMKVKVYANIIRLNRMLGKTKEADVILKEAQKLEKNLKNKEILGLCYLYEAQGDIVDLNMQTSTVENLEKSVELLKISKDTFYNEKLILAYIYQSQVELYFNKDASHAVTMLEIAAAEATKTKNHYYITITEELMAHTYPFFFRYEEGIEALKPVVEEFSKRGYYSEAFRAQDKLVTLAFDSGDSNTALEEGAKLEAMREKVVNQPRKDYFEEYSGTLYKANVFSTEGKLQDAIDLLNSKDLSKFKNVYSVDMSVYNMYQGNLNYYNGNTEKALEHYKAMTKAIEDNSNGDSAYVYTDTSMVLAQAHYDLGQYKEGYDVLARHISAYVTHDMEINKRDTAQLAEKYKTAKTEKELLALQLKTQQKESTSKILTIAAIGFAAVTTVLFIDRRRVKKYNKILSNLSTTDSLTGLSNRRALDEFLGQQSSIMLQVSKATQEEKNIYVSALMMDIDFFKKYNDNYGHTKGDKVLQSFGEILKPFCTSDSDIIARYGGEEFALILTNTDKNKALQIAAKVKKALAEAEITHEFSEVSTIVTASIGVATKDLTVDSIDTLIEDADKALYYSKNNGRNTFTHFSDMK